MWGSQASRSKKSENIGASLKKLILCALLAYAGWNYYQKNVAPKEVEAVEPVAMRTPAARRAEPVASTSAAPAESFSCDGRQHCSQMRSRAEAEYFLRNCPNTKMDGDHDGIPCENDSRF